MNLSIYIKYLDFHLKLVEIYGKPYMATAKLY